eukprot:TRINITY_DN18234_c0_g1_i1.p1 TRINITY_DN18234_c0_g1~~TRINITY_DN18234_c0_g1_i1.p1  ORF type:complete len:337 (+),score=59.87 TRINITY_DN18234_c0_g1_i1:125-1135(+)
MGCGASSTSSPRGGRYAQRNEFLDACEKGDLNKVRQLLRDGADAGQWGMAGDDATQTPRRKLCCLHFAARAENFDTPEGIELFKELIPLVPRQGVRQRCDPQDGDGRTPLWEACRRCHLLVVRELLRQGADPGTPTLGDGTAAIHHAAMENVYGTSEGIHEGSLLFTDMLTSDAIRIADKRGSTPLHYAAYYGNPVALRLLLEVGADPSVSDCHGYAPVDQANRPVSVMDDDERTRAKRLCVEILNAFGTRKKSFYGSNSQGRLVSVGSRSSLSPKSPGRRKSRNAPAPPPPTGSFRSAPDSSRPISAGGSPTSQSARSPSPRSPRGSRIASPPPL